MKKAIYTILFILGAYFFPQANYAQETEIQKNTLNQDNLGNVTDRFQEQFFEALKQKAIGNHEKAILSLEKCIALQPGKAILYIELGKNQKALKHFPSAEKNFKKALKIRSESPYVLIELYEIYVATKNYPEALETVKQLVHFNPDYYEDLTNLYMRLQKPKFALKSLEMLDSLKGSSEDAENLRREIFEVTNNEAGQLAYLKSQIVKKPESQENYLRLIDFYGAKKDWKNAFIWTKKLKEKHPKSEKVHLALYQLYLNQKKYQKAIASIKIILASKELEEVTKIKVLKDFIAFTKKHPNYENALKELLDIATETGESMASNKELGDFYLKKDPKKALQHYNKALKNNFNDVETIETTLLLQLDLKQDEAAVKLSKKALEVFPSRPKLYLSQGMAFNRLQEYSKALESLEFGLGYLIDNPRMEVRFYRQMVIAHRGLLHPKKAATYQEKAEKLKTKLE